MPNNVFKDLQSQYAVLGYNPDAAAYEARVSQLAAFNLVCEKGTVQIQPQNDYFPFQYLTVDADALGVQLGNANGELRLQSQGGLLAFDVSGALVANGGTWSVDYTGRAAFYQATVTGDVSANTFTGNGANLTNISLDHIAAVRFQANNSAAQAIPDQTDTKLNFDTTEWNTGSGTFNGTKYTAPAAGVFDINAQVSIGGGAANSWILKLYKNGALVWQEQTNGSTINATVRLGRKLQLAAGDYLELYVWHNSLATVSINNDAYRRALWSVEKIA